MPISVRCICGKVTQVPVQFGGRRGKCTGCGAIVNIPSTEESEEIQHKDPNGGLALRCPSPLPAPALSPTIDGPASRDDSRDRTIFTRPAILMAIAGSLGAGIGGLIIATSFGAFRSEKARSSNLDSSPSAAAAALRTPGNPSESRGSGPRLSTEEIVTRCEHSVGLVKGHGGTGTGFLILPRVLATNAHVIDQELSEDLVILFPSAPEDRDGPYEADILYFDRERDLALLAVDTDLSPLELAPEGPFQRGSDVTIIGNPGLGGSLTLENAVSSGKLSTHARINEQDYYQISASINPGNSGGPVIDPWGRVLGIASLRATKQEGLGFCIPTPDLRAAVETVRNQTRAQAREAAQRHRLYAGTHSIRLVKEAIESSSPELALAIFDAGKIIPSSDPSVARIRTTLQTAMTVYGLSAQEVISQIASLYKIASGAAANCSCVEILEAIVEIPPIELRGEVTPSDFLTVGKAYISVRLNGERSHREVIAILRDRFLAESIPNEFIGKTSGDSKLDSDHAEPNGPTDDDLYGPARQGYVIRDIHHTRSKDDPPQFGESEWAVSIPRGMRVVLRRVRLKDEEKWRVSTGKGNVIVVEDAFVAKHIKVF